MVPTDSQIAQKYAEPTMPTIRFTTGTDRNKSPLKVAVPVPVQKVHSPDGSLACQNPKCRETFER
jgi:hypothetical protein